MPYPFTATATAYIQIRYFLMKTYLINNFLFVNISWRKNVKIKAVFTDFGVRIPYLRSRKITKKFISALRAGIGIAEGVFWIQSVY